MSRDAILARWPRLAEVLDQPEQVIVVEDRDEATVRALHAYLQSTTDVPSRGDLRL